MEHLFGVEVDQRSLFWRIVIETFVVHQLYACPVEGASRDACKELLPAEECDGAFGGDVLRGGTGLPGTVDGSYECIGGDADRFFDLAEVFFPISHFPEVYLVF